MDGLAILFPTRDQLAHGITAYSDAQFERISTFLKNTGEVKFSTVPRLYTVLHIIGHLNGLDTFLAQGTTDLWFPFDANSLPKSLDPSIQAQFLDTQAIVLSKAFKLETMRGSPASHAHFSRDEPPPFKVLAKLGCGAHGSVDKVMSTITQREYARKLFRRTQKLKQGNIQAFITELATLKRVRHNHCVELVRGSASPTTRKT